MMPILKNVLCCGEMPSSCDSDSRFTEDETGEWRNSEASERQEEEILCSSTSRYRIQTIAGEGGFGVVAKGVNLITSQDVAIKILKMEDYAERESKMMEVVSIIDPVRKNLVKFFETFKYNEQTCLVFEMLDRDLLQLISEQSCKPLSLFEIRPIAHQLLTAFDALKGIGVIHSDLKPSNIMVTNHPSQPFRVKLIDFGLSFTTSEKIHGTIQPLGYRAPEVFLGLPFSEPIDMWGFGCVLIFLFLAKHPFSIHCEYNAMKDIVTTLGQLDVHVLCGGKYTDKFFKENQLWDNPKWWLKTPSEFYLSTGVQPKMWRRVFRSLESLITYNPDIHEPIELEDQRAFVSLLKCLLQTDPERRITPEKALTHPFVTMAHLEDKSDAILHVRNSFARMLICQKNDMEEDLCHGGEAEEEHLAVSETNEAESVLHIEIISHSSDEPQAASEKDAAGSAEEESAVSQGAVIPTMEASTNARSSEEGSHTKVRRSRLRRIQKFFGRAIRTLFGMKNRE